MAVVKVLARDWDFEINNGTEAVPVWVDIRCGLNTLTFSSAKNDADTTDFCSEGWQEHIVASRNNSVSASGFYLEDPDDGTRNAGQELVETASRLFGYDALKQFRLTSPGGTIKIFSGSVALGDIGGGNDDPTSWGFTVTVSGSTTITPP